MSNVVIMHEWKFLYMEAIVGSTMVVSLRVAEFIERMSIVNLFRTLSCCVGDGVLLGSWWDDSAFSFGFLKFLSARVEYFASFCCGRRVRVILHAYLSTPRVLC